MLYNKQGRLSFNPRPPKRTLCPNGYVYEYARSNVSIHVLRRGRCVCVGGLIHGSSLGFNPRPPKRTLCPESSETLYLEVKMFQSTSSEEDVVSHLPVCQPHNYHMFQSTSSEEDVVSQA